MNKLAFATVLSLAMCGSARADETGFNLSKGIATGGFIASGAGPVIFIGGVFLAANSAANSANGDGSGSGIFAGGAAAVVGLGVTAIGPPIVVGSALGGYLAVKNAGGTPSMVPGIIGISGVGIQALGWTMTVMEANRITKAWESGDTSVTGSAADDAVRFVGWTTGLIGGGLQLSVNGRSFRSTVTEHGRHRVQVGLVPTGQGGALVGRF